MGNLGFDEIIILKQILKRQGLRVSTELIYVVIGFSVRLL